MLNDRYFRTTCNKRPHFLGPIGGLKIEGPLYCYCIRLLLTDLSIKAFDCLQYQLGICKLKAYGLGPGSCKLIMNYLSAGGSR